MGREIRCFAEVGDWTGDGRLLLETDALLFRGAKKLTIARGDISRVYDDNGWLVVEHGSERDRFDLGKLTPGWVNAIAHPRSRIDKLEIRPATRVALAGEFDDDFVAELRTRSPHVYAYSERGSAQADPHDVIFLRVEALADLDRLARLRERIVPSGAIWLIHPKGHAELKHEPMVAAAKRAGLIDIKRARFSETHTSLKLVVPKRDRPVARR